MNRNITQNWFLACAAIIGFAFAAEWATRLFAPQPLLHALVRHDSLLEKRNIPFGRTIVIRRDGGRHEIKLNADGFRMDHEIGRSSQLKRVLVYGGSALFASQLPLEMSVFGRLKVLTEEKIQHLQLLNAAVPDHEVRHTRLLMKEQIPKYRPEALIYIFDANTFSRTLILGDRSEITHLRYNKMGQPKLLDTAKPKHSEYLESFWTAFSWLHRHSHLINVIGKALDQSVVFDSLTMRSSPAEVKLSDLPQLAQESTDIQELLYLSELQFQRMVQMTEATDLPFLVVWLPARFELTSNAQNSAVAKILSNHRRMLRRLASEHKNFKFWDSFRNIGEELIADQIYTSDEIKNDQLSIAGSRWFAEKTAPAINIFLQTHLEDPF